MTKSIAAPILAAWLAVVTAVAVAGEPAASIAISDLTDLTAACDAATNEQGVHGGTQNRICRTSHGTYATFLGDGEAKTPVVHLIRIRDDRPERLATIPSTLHGSNGVHVVCDPDEEVFVLAPGVASVNRREHARLSAFHVDRRTGETTEPQAEVPFGRGINFGYSSTFLDRAGRSVYALYSGGDAPGYCGWFRFDMAEKRWASESVVAELNYRHCYNYGFPAGDGAVVIAERDILNETAGVLPTDTNRKIDARYVWDEIRLFHIPDLGRPEYSSVDVEAAVYDKPAGLYPNLQNNYGGDAFVDAQGRTHVFYVSIDNNHKEGRFNRHAVLDAERRVVSNELLPFQGAYAVRAAQSRSGRLYLIVMSYEQPAAVEVWGAVDAEPLRFEKLAEKRLSETVVPKYAGLAVSCPRNGSLQDDRVDCLFPSGRSYYHFRIELE